MAARNALVGLLLCLALVACRTSWRTVPAEDARVQYTGRRYRSDTGVVFSHPGVTIRARFRGDAVRMRLNDGGYGGDRGTNSFNVSIDGGPPKRLEARSGEATYVLAEGLPWGLHTVEVVKRTESSVGPSELVALEVHGELLEPPPRPPLRLEVVGDSITCGYGNEVGVTPADASWTAPTFMSRNQNPALGYGWLTARGLGAELELVCRSGHGVYRNLDGTTSGLLPALYELAVPGRPVAWDFPEGSPDVIVVNVGTNDALAGEGTAEFLPDETAFKTAYRRFLARLRALHPRAHLVCTLGSMMDGSKAQEQSGIVASVHVGEWVTEVVAERSRAGDARVYRHHMAVQNPQVDGVGEDWHPSANTHQKMAEALTRFIQEQVLPPR